MSRDQLLVRRRPGDIETPVSAMLKLGADKAGSFLFESIHGGERLGRYSFIGLYPQRWMRVQDGIGEESAERGFASPKRFDGTAVEALRAFAEAGRADADAQEELPPMASKTTADTARGPRSAQRPPFFTALMFSPRQSGDFGGPGAHLCI